MHSESSFLFILKITVILIAYHKIIMKVVILIAGTERIRNAYYTKNKEFC